MQKWIEKIFFISETIASELAVLRAGYLSSAVNVLTIILKTLHITKRDFFKLNRFHKDQSVWKRRCGSHFSSVWSPI